MPRWTQSIKTRLVLQYKLINPKRLEYVFSVIRLEADCKNRIININMDLCLLRAVIAVQNDNRLRYFVYCPARASVTVIVHRTRVQNAPHNYDADACAPKYYSSRARAYTHSMRMHTYTREYAIYKVARDRVITWCEDTVFCIFCIYVS